MAKHRKLKKGEALKFDPNSTEGQIIIALIETIRSSRGPEAKDLQEIAVALDAAMQDLKLSPGEGDIQEEILDWARRMRTHDYYQGIKGYAKDIWEGADRPAKWEDALDENISNYAEVIYVRDAMDILEASENWEAIEDMGGETVEIESGFLNNILTQAAYWAQEADLREAVTKLVEEEAERVEYEGEDDEPEENPIAATKRRLLAW